MVAEQVPSTLNREAWLTMLMNWMLRQLFADAGAPIPERVRVSCGLPPGRRRRCRPYQYCASFNSADDTWEIFISAALDDPLSVTAALAAALVNICTGCDRGEAFRRVARSVDLLGTSWEPRPGPGLIIRVHEFMLAYGRYAHAAVIESGQPADASRHLKLVCPGCGCPALLTADWIRRKPLKCEECDLRLVPDAKAAEQLARPPRRRGRPRKKPLPDLPAPA